MARARRAKARPARIIVPVVIAALILGGVVLASTRHWFSSGSSTTASSPSVLATEQTASSSTTGTPASQSSSASPSTTTASSQSSSTSTPSPTSSPSSADANQALTSCRSKVQARDAVIMAAKAGVGHWSQHVAAQTAANSGDISVGAMQATFKRTRLAGPADLARYQQALDKEHLLTGACTAPTGGPKVVVDTIARCSERSKDQQPMLHAASDAMTDWKSHLAAMHRSRMGHVHDAQGIWIGAWRAAPPHIKAFQAATSAFDHAPAC